jgi:predicted enzyme related to lactoylglutathione lyase
MGTCLGIVLRTADEARLLRFYRAFGISFIPEKHGDEGKSHHSSTMGGNAVIEIYQRSKKVDDAILIEVDSFDGLLKSLQEEGFSVTHEGAPPKGGIVLIHDPDGREVIVSEKE